MKVKPVDPTAIIRDPHTRIPLPAEGGEVSENSFWTRRLLAGEVVLVDEPTTRLDNAIAPLTTRGGK